MYRHRNTKIIATLGPASADFEIIKELFLAGADAFRLNFSHGNHAEHQTAVNFIRQLENQYHYPIAVIGDLQGPKLRIGKFVNDFVNLEQGQNFCLDLQETLGDEQRVNFPHPEIYQALTVGSELLLNDGKIKLRVDKATDTLISTTVIVGGQLGNRKGVNIPKVLLPISTLTSKDLIDLDFMLQIGVDWVALSFVQTAEDIIHAKNIINNRAKVIAKLEKPMAITHLDSIIQQADAIMVARGDLGVEMPPEEVPIIQKKVVRHCRNHGKPVIIATQMLDSMVNAPTPTRAEASDVATAIYEGVDTVMLSAESAFGHYPKESVMMMDKIIQKTEQDHQNIDNSIHKTANNISMAITTAAKDISTVIDVKAIVTYTRSGATALHMANERACPPILVITPEISVARSLPLVWGAYPVHSKEIYDIDEMVLSSKQYLKNKMQLTKGKIIIISGLPFGMVGSTNMLRIEIIG